MADWERAMRLEVLETYAETGNESLLQELNEVHSLSELYTGSEDLS